MTGLLLTTPRAWLRRALRTGAPSPLAGRTVLVTGASSGIGEATAHGRPSSPKPAGTEAAGLPVTFHNAV